MDAVIVDTNVIITANDEAEHALPDCVERCQKRIKCRFSISAKLHLLMTELANS